MCLNFSRASPANNSWPTTTPSNSSPKQPPPLFFSRVPAFDRRVLPSIQQSPVTRRRSQLQARRLAHPPCTALSRRGWVKQPSVTPRSAATGSLYHLLRISTRFRRSGSTCLRVRPPDSPDVVDLLVSRVVVCALEYFCCRRTPCTLFCRSRLGVAPDGYERCPGGQPNIAV